MSKNANKILGAALNVLASNNQNDGVNDLIKSSIEMGDVSIDSSFEFLEEDVRESIGEVITRSTYIDIMKTVDNVANIPNITKVCSDAEAYRKAINFMKVAKPKFFEEKRHSDEDEERMRSTIEILKNQYSRQLDKQRVIKEQMERDKWAREQKDDYYKQNIKKYFSNDWNDFDGKL